jgi:hypothetical protein
MHKGYTYMSDEAITATIAANNASPETHYTMDLNSEDFAYLMFALRLAWEHGSGEAISDWAGDLASSIAQTLNVEWI